MIRKLVLRSESAIRLFLLATMCQMYFQACDNNAENRASGARHIPSLPPQREADLGRLTHSSSSDGRQSSGSEIVASADARKIPGTVPGLEQETTKTAPVPPTPTLGTDTAGKHRTPPVVPSEKTAPDETISGCTERTVGNRLVVLCPDTDRVANWITAKGDSAPVEPMPPSGYRNPDKTLDGLFTMLAEEEKKIRENPLARSTDLLKKVFK